jgi:hypothetical protein
LKLEPPPETKTASRGGEWEVEGAMSLFGGEIVDAWHLVHFLYKVRCCLGL